MCETPIYVSSWRDNVKNIIYRTEAIVVRCSVKKVFLKISKIHRKTTVLEIRFNKSLGLRPLAIFIKKRLQHRFFSLNFVKFIKTPFYRIPTGDYF